MANFSFLENKSEYTSFSKACIDAEEGFQTSPDACVKLVRTALEYSVKWVYRKDNRLVKKNNPKSGEKESLLALTTTPTFKNAVGKSLLNKIHHCRTLGNNAIHNNAALTNDDALNCLRNLFDFVQWIDKNYGTNYRARTFDPEEVPVKDSTLSKFLKGAALVGAGVVGKFIFDILTDDKS